MASNLKVDIVRPTATNGSLSLKGDSGGSATTNGVTVNSSGNTSITGTTTVSSLVATTADINGGTIDATTITTSDITVGSGKTLDVSAGTLTLANDQISGDKVEGGTIAATTITTLTSTTIKAGDGAEATPSITNTGDTNTGIYFPAADTVGVSTGGSERMRIDSSGHVCINCTSATDAQSGGIAFIPSGGSCDMTVGSITTNNDYVISFYNPNGNVGNIGMNGSATYYNTSSDYRLKEDLQPIVDAIERLQSLKPVNFAWKVDGSRVDGFLAHEAQEVVPEAVTGEKDAMRIEEYEVTPAVLDNDGNIIEEAVMGTREVPDYQGIDQSKLVPLLTAALQEAVSKIESLEQRIAALETAAA